MKTLIYFKSGAIYMGCHERTKADIADQKALAQKQGHIGYLVGHRYFDGQKDRVIVFFKAEPTKAEMLRRRANGFVGARWYAFKTKGYNRWDHKAGGVVYIPPNSLRVEKPKEA